MGWWDHTLHVTTASYLVGQESRSRRNFFSKHCKIMIYTVMLITSTKNGIDTS